MRVLLVEGNSRHAAAIFADLKTDAIRADIAETGEDALYFMRNHEFDLVLINLVLPDMDGTALISRIRSAKHNTPIIALSAVPQARLKALGVGADDVVERDMDRAELAARIRAIVRRSTSSSRMANSLMVRCTRMPLAMTFWLLTSRVRLPTWSCDWL